MEKESIKIVLLGSGNVATLFLKYILEESDKLELVSVYSRKASNHIKDILKNCTKTIYCNSLDAIPRDADLYIFCLSDDALQEVFSMMPVTKGIWVHTAGSVFIDCIKKYHKDAAVIYPLQSIKKGNIPSKDMVPVFLEVNSDTIRDKVSHIAKILFTNIYWADSRQRKALHLAAVFACNFTNHLYSISYDILEHFDLDTKAIAPLILHTAERLRNSDPRKLQTGPAQREDYDTISRHKELMKDANLSIIDIYNLLTETIIDRKYYKSNDYFCKKDDKR